MLTYCSLLTTNSKVVCLLIFNKLSINLKVLDIRLVPSMSLFVYNHLKIEIVVLSLSYIEPFIST